MVKNMKRFTALLISSVLTLSVICFFMTGAKNQENDYIKYAEFNVTYNALKKALDADISSHDSSIKLSWTDILAYLGAKYGGDFSKYRDSDMDDIIEQLKDGKDINTLTKDMKYFGYYKQVYSAVLDGLVGEYEEYSCNENSEPVKTTKYGLKAYSPIAKGFAFSHFDDFGAVRTYGYTREHLGHDMMCAVGTPIIAVEDGTVEAVGWNQYGGWRIGIRSHDKKRYYYYAHLRQNRPYHCDIKEGCEVHAGDVIGYAGRTGYSTKENVNNIETPHLHFGIELIFDESQKECDNEIWIDLYALTQLLETHKSDVRRNSETKEFFSLRQSGLLNSKIQVKKDPES